jgi:transcriptional regulator GlxA family with amidase domain
VEHLDRRVLTAAGVSAGIDMGIRLVELLVDGVAARAAQVMIEYDPRPPFDAGHPDRVGPDVMARVGEYGAVRA